MRTIAALACTLLLATTVQAKSLDTSLSPAAAQKKLDALRSKVRTMVGQGKKPVIVFDIDDTLVRIFTKKQVPGASAFVNGLLSDGAKLIYQCARKESQRATVTDLLSRNGMPLNGSAELWLKPQKEKASAVEWKRSQKAQIKAQGFPVGFFDNEKVNARMFKEEFPKSCVFRLNIPAYYPDPGGTKTIYVIDNYCPTN